MLSPDNGGAVLLPPARLFLARKVSRRLRSGSNAARGRRPIVRTR